MTDYLLGVADLTGELMRVCINCVAVGKENRVQKTSGFIRDIYDVFCRLKVDDREIPKKLEVMKASLQKVEQVCFNMALRGSEYPKEMIMAMNQDQYQEMEE
eukprot:TRINITY_DN3414_c0_g1_i1.p1 TRINITY_DN3414_c0_g1~~TRINITY_DN3414_c0_g1_i1.p1  ORF type:complete len:102 (-),score=33.43 TRINITY_DN3414_c0_g1_i1:93-398(-)